MKRPWSVQTYDARVIIVGAYDHETHTQPSVELIPSQSRGRQMPVAELVAMAEQICAAVNQ